MNVRGRLAHPVTVARRATRRRVAGKEEAGFTLIELLIVVVILPVVIGGISVALLSVFGLQNQTQNRIGASDDAQVGSANFNKDVQSAEQLTSAPFPNGSAPGVQGCGASTQDQGNAVQLLGLEWGANAAAPGGYDTVVSYVLLPETTPNSNLLVRQECTFGTSTTPSTTLTISRDAGNPPSTCPLPAPPPATPSPGLCITPSNIQTLSQTSWQLAQGVTNVTLTITEPEGKSQGSTAPDQYTYSLVGLPGESTSTSPPPGSVLTNVPWGCSFANVGTGTYANQLCFADLSYGNSAGWTPPVGTCQTMSLPIENTPDTLSFCIRESTAGDVAPNIIPTYYSPSGDDSEAFLGNNGFYTGIPGEPALYQQNSGTLDTVYLTNIQVKNSATNQAATGWTLVTGDAESTDANEWMVFQSNLDWSVLYNNGSSDPYGNSCYDTNDTNNVGFLQYLPTTPPTTNGAIPATSKASLPVSPSTFPQTGATSVLCESSIQLNKTGSLMVEAQQGASLTPQTLTVSMKGAGLEAMFVGVLL
jgi:prepilin-type N-terminal cleavage/methylation domain-containing protein